MSNYYKHPDLGVTCLTNSGYWNMEAKRTGKEAWELQEEFFEDMAREEADQANRYLIPANAFEFICGVIDEYFDQDDKEYLPVKPNKVFKVIKSEYSIGRVETTKVICEASRVDTGKIERLYCEVYNDGGSYMEPPDSEAQVYWESEINT